MGLSCSRLIKYTYVTLYLSDLHELDGSRGVYFDSRLNLMEPFFITIAAKDYRFQVTICQACQLSSQRST